VERLRGDSAKKKQIPGGNDRKKGKGNGNSGSKGNGKSGSKGNGKSKARAGLWLIPPVREVRVRMGHPELWRESCYARSGYMRGARLAMDFGGLAGD
jgi:hypothetical protein